VLPESRPDLAEASWTELLSAAQACNACGLCAGRGNTTLRPPGYGAFATESPDSAVAATWMVIGEPPDEDEDHAAHAFAGPSGTLLDNMLRALDLARNRGAYLTNVVKCRPPHGAVPQAADLQQCAAYLQREIALMQPAVILAMGRFAQQALLSDQPELVSLPLGKLRGKVHRYRDIPVVFTYHPKALLRNAADKGKAWADLCLAADAATALNIT
jgi:DNA polymerase